MTDTQRPWDRRTTESDPAYEAFAAYLDTGSLRDAYRQRSGNEKATPFGIGQRMISLKKSSPISPCSPIASAHPAGARSTRTP